MIRNDHGLIGSFGYAIKGLLYAIRHERNFRIHITFTVYVLYFSRYYGFSRLEYAVLLLVTGLVMACELLNTAIERAVDIKTPVYNGLAKTAKNVAAGAVLLSGITAAVIGVLLFWDIAVLKRIFLDIAAAPFLWVLLLAVTVVWIMWPRRGAIKRRFR